MSRLRIAAAAQLLFFAAWAGWLASAPLKDTGDIWLETEPVDPRDLLSGTFVALSYRISAPEPCRGLVAARASSVLYVRLEDRGRTASTASGTVNIHEATDCALKPGAGLWARASVTRPDVLRLTYGIERFYLNENDRMKDARSGSIVAKAAMNRGNRLGLKELVKKN